MTLQLLLTAATASYALFPPSDRQARPFPRVFATVKRTGAFPDRTSLLTRYTGVRVLDRALTALAEFFSPVVDGRDPGTAYALGA